MLVCTSNHTWEGVTLSRTNLGAFPLKVEKKKKKRNTSEPSASLAMIRVQQHHNVRSSDLITDTEANQGRFATHTFNLPYGIGLNC